LRDQRGNEFVLVLVLAPIPFSNYFEDEDEDEDEKQKRLHFHKTENEGIRRVSPKTAWRSGLILLFAEKCPEAFGADERNPTGILTWASNLLPPSRSCEQWHWAS
jgi:hypothetical protein